MCFRALLYFSCRPEWPGFSYDLPIRIETFEMRYPGKRMAEHWRSNLEGRRFDTRVGRTFPSRPSCQKWLHDSIEGWGKVRRRQGEERCTRRPHKNSGSEKHKYATMEAGKMVLTMTTQRLCCRQWLISLIGLFLDWYRSLGGEERRDRCQGPPLRPVSMVKRSCTELRDDTGRK